MSTLPVDLFGVDADEHRDLTYFRTVGHLHCLDRMSLQISVVFWTLFPASEANF